MKTSRTALAAVLFAVCAAVASAQDASPAKRYLELEFTSTGTRRLVVEYAFLPDVPCDRALARP